VVLQVRTERHLATRRPRMLDHKRAILDAVSRAGISTKTILRRGVSGITAVTSTQGAGYGWL